MPRFLQQLIRRSVIESARADLPPRHHPPRLQSYRGQGPAIQFSAATHSHQLFWSHDISGQWQCFLYFVISCNKYGTNWKLRKVTLLCG